MYVSQAYTHTHTSCFWHFEQFKGCSQRPWMLSHICHKGPWISRPLYGITQTTERETREGVGGAFFKISRLLLVRFWQIRAHFKAEKVLYHQIRKIFLSRNCLTLKFAKCSCCEIFLLYSISRCILINQCCHPLTRPINHYWWKIQSH